MKPENQHIVFYAQFRNQRSYDALKFYEKIFQETRKIASKMNVDKEILEIKPRTTHLSVYRANAGP